ncbi:hypothetical protein NC652_001661 [Populus alba x Populus x berolinensis]|nr:hypothetical protein NC652_001661 [Populus alba x Populus x berolinensis]
MEANSQQPFLAVVKIISLHAFFSYVSRSNRSLY